MSGIKTKENDHLLDIGCGWGGLARFAAERTGCRVTAVNISGEQLGYTRELCQDLPVHFLDVDFREIRGLYSQIVSVRMWEYYLLSCAGSFRARITQVWQVVLTKCGTPQPDCRVWPVSDTCRADSLTNTSPRYPFCFSFP